MSATAKITPAQIAYARAQTELRRRALIEAAKYPSVAQLAAELNVSERYLQKILAGKERIGNALAKLRELLPA